MYKKSYFDKFSKKSLPKYDFFNIVYYNAIVPALSIDKASSRRFNEAGDMLPPV